MRERRLAREGQIIADGASDEAFESYWRRPDADARALRRWSGSLFPLTPEYIAAGDVWITTGTDGQIAGFIGAGTPRCAGHTWT
jgi:2-furoate---CoA ligase